MVGNLVWAAMAFVALRGHGRPIRAVVAACATPAAVIAGVRWGTGLVVALALVLPAAASWRATQGAAELST